MGFTTRFLHSLELARLSRLRLNRPLLSTLLLVVVDASTHTPPPCRQTAPALICARTTRPSSVRSVLRPPWSSRVCLGKRACSPLLALPEALGQSCLKSWGGSAASDGLAGTREDGHAAAGPGGRRRGSKRSAGEAAGRVQEDPRGWACAIESGCCMVRLS